MPAVGVVRLTDPSGKAVEVKAPLSDITSIPVPVVTHSSGGPMDTATSLCIGSM